MTRFTLQAPAKLNLLLAVSPTIEQGRHTLTSVFTTIDLCDKLTFSFASNPERRITLEVLSAPDIPPLNLPMEQNIVYKAVAALEESCARELKGHLHILLEKSIPPEAGLAGGSSNAATTLKALASIWDLDPLGASVIEAAKRLGADVPYFLYNSCALMGGNGSQLLKLLPQPALDVVLVKPPAGVSTAAAYAAFDADPQPEPPAQPLVTLLEQRNASPQLIANQLANNLTSAACSLLPELAALITDVAAQPGVYAALMTGSGSTVFGVCESADTAKGNARYFQRQGYWATPATTA
ncbi:MAG: 4-(cytidine 5'-diphospho)-2-C-methyl-D-erythritol kinase [Coriobacteriia bacterium]|nr:4-(cytidine 5'-diphospho)-2-C-methyl-D-erythritol kinase [Coriobacteriia bacterium]